MNSISRKILDWNTEELGAGSKSDRRSTEKYKEAIR